MSQVNWEITGRIMLEENEVNGSGKTMTRSLANVEVEVSGSNFGAYNSWGTVRTDSNGYFTLRKEKDRSKRKIKVKVRFADSELEINTGALANPADFVSPAIEVFEHANEVEGPTINIGTRTFRAGAAGELGDRDNRRRAIAWYVCKTLINTFQAKDSYFGFKGKVKVVYPANVVSGKPYANGVTRSVYMHATPNNDQWWKVQVLVHEFMHLWNYDHNHGTANWFGAVFCPIDLNTHAQAERRPIAFHEGFAEYASWELLHELWGDEPDATRDKKLPYTRYALVHDLHLDTVDEVEQSDIGVFRALCLLTGRAIYARRFGDKQTRLDTNPYAEKVDIDGLNCPENPRLTIWDVLKVFQANPAQGYSTEWQVGSNDYGVRRFFERAADVLDRLDDPTKDLMLSLIDPNSREEPQSRCEVVRPVLVGSSVAAGKVPAQSVATVPRP
ncbi:MAG TPA: hypothetical protein VFV95_09855 [Vicinamibacterales bacterium]|nr:hypothetical protein [Vicinamibacterales bacterium]